MNVLYYFDCMSLLWSVSTVHAYAWYGTFCWDITLYLSVCHTCNEMAQLIIKHALLHGCLEPRNLHQRPWWISDGVNFVRSATYRIYIWVMKIFYFQLVTNYVLEMMKEMLSASDIINGDIASDLEWLWS